MFRMTLSIPMFSVSVLPTMQRPFGAHGGPAPPPPGMTLARVDTATWRLLLIAQNEILTWPRGARRQRLLGSHRGRGPEFRPFKTREGLRLSQVGRYRRVAVLAAQSGIEAVLGSIQPGLHLFAQGGGIPGRVIGEVLRNSSRAPFMQPHLLHLVRAMPFRSSESSVFKSRFTAIT